MEALRIAAARLAPHLAQTMSPSSPKICIVWPRTEYMSTGGAKVAVDEVDVVVRGVSVGNFHRTVPATMLSALAVAGALQGSLVEEAVGKRLIAAAGDDVELRVGHPAGVAEASVRVGVKGDPVSIVYVRTARRLFQGEVLVHPDIGI